MRYHQAKTHAWVIASIVTALFVVALYVSDEHGTPVVRNPNFWAAFLCLAAISHMAFSRPAAVVDGSSIEFHSMRSGRPTVVPLDRVSSVRVSPKRTEFLLEDGTTVSIPMQRFSPGELKRFRSDLDDFLQTRVWPNAPAA